MFQILEKAFTKVAPFLALYPFNLDLTLLIITLSAEDQSSSYLSSEYFNEESKN